MIDVARRAGVSQSTVSYVLSGTRPISATVRERVERAVRDLNYTPHAAAKALRGDRTFTLALSLPASAGVTSVVIGMYVLQLARSARDHGFDLLLSTDPDRPEAALAEILGSRRADGALLMSLAPGDRRVAVALDSGMPVVAIGRPEHDSALPWVDFDFQAAVAAAVARLVGRGHRSLLYAGPSDEENAGGYLYVRRALSGFFEAADAAGVGVHVVNSSSDPVLFEARIAEVLRSPEAPTGVVGMGVQSVGALTAAVRRHLGAAASIDDIVLVARAGHDGDLLPGQTYIGNPVDVVASSAVEMVAAAIHGEAVASRYTPMSLARWARADPAVPIPAVPIR